MNKSVIQPSLRRASPPRLVGVELGDKGNARFDTTTGELNLQNDDTIKPWQQNGNPMEIPVDAPYGPNWVKHYLTLLRAKWSNPYYSFLMQVSGACGRNPFESDDLRLNTEHTRNTHPSDDTLAQRIISALDAEQAKNFLSAVVSKSTSPDPGVLRQIFGQGAQEVTNLPWSMQLENLGTIQVNPIYTFAINMGHQMLQDASGKTLDLNILITGKSIKTHFADLIARIINRQLFVNGSRVSSQLLTRNANRELNGKLMQMARIEKNGDNDYRIPVNPVPQHSPMNTQSYSDLVTAYMSGYT